MERQNILNLIKYHFEKKDIEFVKECKSLSQNLKDCGEIMLAKEIDNIIKKYLIVDVGKRL